MLSHPWPLFELRIRSPRLELRLPTEAELLDLLDVAGAGIHPPEEMPFAVPWTDVPSPEFERSFMQYHWGTRSQWRPDNWALDLGVWADGRLVGSQGIGAISFGVLRTVATGSWLGRDFQRRGIGREMRAAVLALGFDHLGAQWATSGAFTDNPSSAAVSRALGYQENGRERLAPRGVAKELVRYLLTAEQWRARERPPIEVTGLERSLALFGVDDAVVRTESRPPHAESG
ncbi:MAG: GNAT family N-acetyltransferase [Chloroflexota bacterium]|nr:GNAT family N-acetyltransferase [Chloroflexota bacterium]